MTSVGIVHISDLHLGANISGYGGFRVFPGATAHDEAALDALFQAMAQIFASEDYPLALVVSGDVSAWGSSAELSMYLTLRDKGYPRSRFMSLPPLVQDFDRVLDIPGNHDYWNGWLVNPWVNYRARGFFPQLPWRFSLETDKYIISLNGVCSTLASSPQEQPSAVGRFHAYDLRILERSLTLADSEAQNKGLMPFKLIVTHHSPSYGSPAAKGFCATSINDLATLCAKYDVKGLLTGHVHARCKTPKLHLPVETRCGTTTQRDWLRLKWLAQGQVRRGHPLDFLYHRFTDVNDGLEWTMIPWDYNGVTFKPTQSVIV
jgi:DNA repair exonuclease SbcCD nuclease subunit